MTAARAVVCLGLIALTATACGGTRATTTTGTTKATGAARPLPWPETTPQVAYGFIRSLRPMGRGYLLRLDLHLLFGPDRTGLAACIDNHECAPGTTSFPDDSYDHDLRYVVAYYLPPGAPVELVTFAGTPATVTARYFYGLAHGLNPRHLGVMAPGRDALREFAFFVEAAPRSPFHKGYEPVLRLYQQFHP